MLRFAEISLGIGGLPCCAHCEARAEPVLRPASDVIADALAAVRDWDADDAGPGPNLTFAGAEPFAHADLPGILHASIEGGVSRLRLRTAGNALGAYDNAEGVLHAGVRHVEVVVLGDARAHDEMTGRPGSADAMSRGVRTLLDAASARHLAVAVTGLVPICRHNLEFAPGAVAMLAAAGATAVTLQVEQAAASVGSGTWLSAACDTGIVNRTWVGVECTTAPAGLSPLHLVVIGGSR